MVKAIPISLIAHAASLLANCGNYVLVWYTFQICYLFECFVIQLSLYVPLLLGILFHFASQIPAQAEFAHNVDDAENLTKLNLLLFKKFLSCSVQLEMFLHMFANLTTMAKSVHYHLEPYLALLARGESNYGDSIQCRNIHYEQWICLQWYSPC